MKYLAAGAFGFLLCALPCWFYVIPTVRENWRAQGRTEAKLQADRDMLATVRKLVPEQAKDCRYLATVGGVKAGDTVDIVDCGTYKTLRVTKND